MILILPAYLVGSGLKQAIADLCAAFGKDSPGLFGREWIETLLISKRRRCFSNSPGLFGREWIETTSSLVCDQGGRTIHIHFAVSDSAGNSRVISQFCFADTLTKEICTTHEYYSSRGEQDTTLAGGRDSVFPRSGYESFMLATQQNADGTMLAYHTIQIA